MDDRPDGERPDFSRYSVRERYAGSIKAGYNAYFYDRSPESCQYHGANERAAWRYGYEMGRSHLLGLPE